MRALSATLLSAQREGGFPLIKAIFTKTGETTKGYSFTTTDRLTGLKQSDQDWLQTADVTIDNHLGNLTGLDLTGFKCIISKGYNTTVVRAAWAASTVYALLDVVIPTTVNGFQYICTVAGTSHSSEPTFPTDLGVTVTETGGVEWTMDGNTSDEYSPTAPMKVIAENDQILIGEARVVFSCAGLANQMEEDEASEEEPRSLLFLTVKSIIAELTDNVATFAPYSHTEAITTSYGDEDSLIDTYKPEETFHFGSGAARAQTVKSLLAWTRMAPRFEDDGNLHIDILVNGDAPTWTASTAYIVGDTVIPTTPNDNVYKCTTAGTSGSSEPTFPTTEDQTVNDNTVVWTLTYDYQYNSDFVATNHQFWEGSARKRLVIPNKVTYKSHPSHIPQYSGSATDATDFALLPLETFHQVRLQSNAQGVALSAAEIDRLRADAEQAALLSPPNVGQEVWDLVRITDNRIGSGTVRIGNVRAIEVTFTPGSFQTRLRFGSGPALAPLGISDEGIGSSTFEGDVQASLEAITDWISKATDSINRNTGSTDRARRIITGLFLRVEALEQGGGLTNLDDLTVQKLTIERQLIVPRRNP